MRKMIKGQKGLSLVEVTIMLLVLMLLTSVLAPSIMDFVHDAQWVKVKEDCEAIGLSISRLIRDVGPCLTTNGGACERDNRADVLISDGADATLLDDGAVQLLGNGNINTSKWNNAAPNNLDTLEDQLVSNGPGYATPFANFTSYYPVGPQFNLGWRGAYLSPPIGPDPWGSKYYVNSGFLDVSTDADDNGAGDQGYKYEWWDYDVFCISAGPNHSIQTKFATSAVVRQNDDFIYVISGSSR